MRRAGQLPGRVPARDPGDGPSDDGARVQLRDGCGAHDVRDGRRVRHPAQAAPRARHGRPLRPESARDEVDGRLGASRRAL